MKMTMPRLIALFLILPMTTTLISCRNHTPDGPNPLLSEWDTPFGVPPFDRIETRHYLPAFEEAIARHTAEIDSIASNPEAPSFENTILAYDRSGRQLSRIANVFFMVAAADNNPEMQAVQEKVSPMLSAHSDGIMHDEALFSRVKAVYDAVSSEPDPLRKRLTEKTYKEFVRSGALLTPDKKQRLQQINGELSLLQVKFGNNLLSENKAFTLAVDSSGIAGLPTDVVTAAAAAAEKNGKPGQWVFTLGKPSLIPFLTHAERRDLREKLYKGYLDRCNYGNETDNKQVVNDMVRLRTERARLLGYSSHAAFVLDDEMARTPENVYSLLDDLWKPALRRAMDELADMKKIRKQETGSDDFASWDWWYYAEKVRKAEYDLDEEALRPYFSLENVRNGIFMLSNRLYGLTFRPVTAPVYNSECHVYEVLDMDNSHLGVLYLDFFPRDGKSVGAWCGTFRDQSYDAEGKRISPVVSIVCNFTRPTSANRPALLNLDETATFFHEFGHALHNFFLDVKYDGLASVEHDFVELPSQIMENWAFEPELLRRYALHHQTGNPIPDRLIEKIQNSKLFNQGFATVEYLAASYTDMDIHNLSEYAPLDVNAFEKKSLSEKRGLIPEIEPRYRYPYFSHIFDGGYSAGYYGYIWSEVLDKDAYRAFAETGDIFNRDVALRFRREVLSKGGTADGMTLYRNFRGQEPSREPLLRARGLIGESSETSRPAGA